MSDLKQYLPLIYKDVAETDKLMQTEDLLFEELLRVFLLGKNNQFIMSADADGITEYENIAGIISNASESLDFRRQRVLNRFSTQQVFTMHTLRAKLDEIIGVGKWTATLDNENYTLYIESSAIDQGWYNELLITINTTKPANIVFINRPLISNDVLIGESVEYSQRLWNYKLGVSWQLGQSPFASIHQVGEIKMSDTPSIKPLLLNNRALDTATEVAKARINNTYDITTFEIKRSNDNLVTVQYALPTSSGITQVTNIKLLDSNDNVLTESVVYVPTLTDIILKHKILVKEG